MEVRCERRCLLAPDTNANKTRNKTKHFFINLEPPQICQKPNPAKWPSPATWKNSEISPSTHPGSAPTAKRTTTHANGACRSSGRAMNALSRSPAPIASDSRSHVSAPRTRNLGNAARVLHVICIRKACVGWLGSRCRIRSCRRRQRGRLSRCEYLFFWGLVSRFWLTLLIGNRIWLRFRNRGMR